MMPPAPATFIHLGLPKTASTTLQTQLFEHHSQLHYFGKFTKGGVHQPVRPAFLAKQVKILHAGADNILEQSIPDQLAYAAKHKLTPLLSQEGLANGTPERKREQAQRFKETFGPCSAILVLREPTSFIQSFYTQQLVNFHTISFGQRAQWMQQLGKPPRYFDVNQWLDLCWNPQNPPQKILSTADTADIFADVFGRENIHLFIFEELVQTPERFLKRLSDCLNIDTAESIQLTLRKRVNDRITADIVDQIKTMEKSFMQRHRFRRADTQTRWDMLFSDPGCTEKLRPELSNAWKKTIQEFCRDQNHRLAEDWNLPLADYGYTL
jgi:hypothetical protein